MSAVLTTPWSKDAFEAKYQMQTDPWGFATSTYELARYENTLSVLQSNHYTSAFEPGCSVGVLTSQLAQRCSHVLAWDVAFTAVQQARKRCQRLAGVTIECKDLSVEPPKGPFDLIVFSEIGYYFSAAKLVHLINQLQCLLNPGGEFIAVHWLGHSADHQLHGSDVHAILKAHLNLRSARSEKHPFYAIDTWIYD